MVSLSSASSFNCSGLLDHLDLSVVRNVCTFPVYVVNFIFDLSYPIYVNS